MEFPFRDAKRTGVASGAVLAKSQYAGFSQCQSRQVEGLHFHWNRARLAVSTSRLTQLRDRRASPLVFTIEDEKRRAYNGFFAESMLSILAAGTTGQKPEDLIASLVSLGIKAA